MPSELSVQTDNGYLFCRLLITLFVAPAILRMESICNLAHNSFRVRNVRWRTKLLMLSAQTINNGTLHQHAKIPTSSFTVIAAIVAVAIETGLIQDSVEPAGHGPFKGKMVQE